MAAFGRHPLALYFYLGLGFDKWFFESLIEDCVES